MTDNHDEANRDSALRFNLRFNREAAPGLVVMLAETKRKERREFVCVCVRACAQLWFGMLKEENKIIGLPMTQ